VQAARQINVHTLHKDDLMTATTALATVEVRRPKRFGVRTRTALFWRHEKVDSADVLLAVGSWSTVCRGLQNSFVHVCFSVVISLLRLVHTAQRLGDRA
jgi:hypothetical protein